MRRGFGGSLVGGRGLEPVMLLRSCLVLVGRGLVWRSRGWDIVGEVVKVVEWVRRWLVLPLAEGWERLVVWEVRLLWVVEERKAWMSLTDGVPVLRLAEVEAVNLSCGLVEVRLCL